MVPEKIRKKGRAIPEPGHGRARPSGMNSTSDPHAGFAGLIRRTATASVVTGALAFFAGCEAPESHVVSAPPPPNPVVSQPVAAQTAPQVVVAAPTPATGTIIVTQAPPAQQQEVVQARPSSAHAWVPGYWTWRNSRYEWMGGHWEIPPRTNATWVAPRWERLDDGSYRFYEGYWE